MSAVSGRLCCRAVAAQRHAAEGAEHADERAAIRARISLRRTLFAVAGPADHRVAFLELGHRIPVVQVVRKLLYSLLVGIRHAARSTGCQSVLADLLDQGGPGNTELGRGMRAVLAMSPQGPLDVQSLQRRQRMRHVFPVEPHGVTHFRGKVKQRNRLVTARCQQRTFEYVLHFADIAGPGVLYESLKRDRGQARR